MSPTPAAGFFGGVQSGFQARSNYAASQQAAQEKLRTHMRLVKNDRDALQGQISDDAVALITEFQGADKESMGAIQDKMQYFVDTTEDKSMLPSGFLDGSYGLQVSGGVAEAMVGPDPVDPNPRATTGGQLPPAAQKANASKDAAYNKLKSKRTKDISDIQAGGNTPEYVIRGYGSQAAYERQTFQDESHLELLGIVSNGGTTNPAETLRDPEAWSRAKDEFYIKAQAKGMDDKDAKAIVDRFEKDRELAEAGLDTMVEQSAALTEDMHKFLGKWFQIEGGMGEIMSKIQGREKAAYLGAIKEGLQSIVAHPEQQSAGLMMTLFNILDQTSQMQSGSPSADGSTFEFNVAQTRPNAGSKPIIPSGTPEHGVVGMKNIPGAMYGTDGEKEYLSVIHPGTGELFYVEGADAIKATGDANQKLNRERAARQIAEQDAEIQKAKNEEATKRAAEKKAAADLAAPAEAERQKKVSALRDTEIVGDIRSGLGAVKDFGSDVGELSGYLVDDAGNLIEEGYGGVKRGASKVRNVAESIFGGL